MNWTHSSRGLALAALLAIAVLTAGTATAISVSGSSPGASQVGEQVSMTITVEQPFADRPGQWTLGGDTELQNASWTVTTLEQGRTIATNQYGSNTFQQALDIENGATEIEITVEGTVPPLNSGEYNYREPGAENFTVATISSVVDDTNSELNSWSAHRYTDATRSAREAIDDAQAAVANSSSSEAGDTLNTSISLYDDGNFEQAENLADEARSTAEEASGGLPILPIAGGVVVILIIVVGVYYWRSQQSSGHKLQ
jgi:hypothetical protein